jgi:hypothetical protein
MLKRTIGALAVAALMLPAAVGAQQNATITLRSGEKVTGQLVDLGGVGFTMKVNGQDRRIPVSQVSVVDFGGGDLSDADWAKFTSGSNAVFLKNGETINGQLHDISGRTPLKVLIKTDSGNREFSADEVGRIVLARPDSAVATSGSTAGVPEGEGVAVIANQQWTSTGMTVRRGDVLTFDATGEAKLNAGGEVARPSGTGTDRKIQGALSQVPAGALIARVGNGEPFPIGGPTATVTMPANGVLYLGLNDDHFGDNSGGFRVKVQRQSRR